MTDNKADIIKRVKHLRISLGLNSGEFALKAGIDPRNYSSIETGKRAIGDRVMRDICNAFDVNIDWLLTGEGEMLKESPFITSPNSVIRYWPELIATGGDRIVFNAEQRSGFQEMRLPNFTDCTDAIPLIGDSMYPRYKSGQIIVVKPWVESFIEYGQIYLIVTRSNYCTIKYLRPCSDRSKITCCSENAECYPPFEIPLDEISNLYIVKGAIEQNTY